jgi:hypothetical protein
MKVRASALCRYKREFLFTLCASLYILPFMKILVLGTDEGTLISGAVRIVHGEIFARDFFEIMGPGTFYWLALFFNIFGVTFAASRICLFVTSVGTLLLMSYLSRRICSSYAVLPPMMVIATYCWTWPAISHHTDSNLFALLATASACLWLKMRRPSLLFAAGVLAGITTCFLQPKGVLLFLALLIWIVIEHRRGSRSGAASAFASLLGGYGVAAGTIILYFAWHGALHDLIYANFIWPHRNYGAANVVPFARGVLAYYWETWDFKSAIGYAIGAVLLVPYLLTVAIPVFLPIAGVRWRDSFVLPEVRLFWLCGWGLWLSEIHRKDIVHLVFGSPLLIILIVYYAERLPVRASKLFLQALATTIICLAGYNLLLLLYTQPLKTRVGFVSTFRNGELVKLLEQKTHAGEEIFAYPYCPIYYFLTRTVNPTRYSLLLYHYNTTSEFKEVLQVLQRHRVKYVVWDTHFQDVAVSKFFPSAGLVDPASRIIEPYLDSHYKQIWSEGGYRLMELKSDRTSAAETAAKTNATHSAPSSSTQIRRNSSQQVRVRRADILETAVPLHLASKR